MIILPFIPILALIVQTSVSLNDLLKYQVDSTDTETQVNQVGFDDAIHLFRAAVAKRSFFFEIRTSNKGYLH